MANFPTLSCGQPILYPATREVQIRSRVIEFTDGSEQRWKASPALSRWSMVFANLSDTDVATLLQFFGDCKGAFDKTWSITVGSTTYNNMRFEHDDFPAVEGKPGAWSITLRAKQWKL